MKFTRLLLPLLLVASTSLHAEEPRRSVNVTGQGEVSVKPDRARLSVAVDTANVVLREAEKETNRIVSAYLVELKSLGLKEEQISTAGVSINPEFVWDEKARRQKLVTYHARREIELRIDDLQKVGDVILKATAVGINQVNPPALESSNSKALSRQALVKATEDARSKAQLLADTLGVKLGVVRNISANDNSAPPVMYKAMMVRSMAADAAPSGNEQMGFTTGEIKYSANVSADFDLIAPP
jgi:uncharacterized protein YggE